MGECGSEQQRGKDGGSTTAPVIIWSFSAITFSFSSASHTLTHFSLPLSLSLTLTHKKHMSEQTHIHKKHNTSKNFSLKPSACHRRLFRTITFVHFLKLVKTIKKKCSFLPPAHIHICTQKHAHVANLVTIRRIQLPAHTNT